MFGKRMHEPERTSSRRPSMFSSFKRNASALCLITVFLTQWAIAAPVRDDDEDHLPTGKGHGERAAPGNRAPRAVAGTGANGINYHGGPVMQQGANVYYIWYGNWQGDSATSILADLASHLGGSPYFNINSTYYDALGRHVPNVVGIPS